MCANSHSYLRAGIAGRACGKVVRGPGAAKSGTLMRTWTNGRIASQVRAVSVVLCIIEASLFMGWGR